MDPLPLPDPDAALTASAATTDAAPTVPPALGATVAVAGIGLAGIALLYLVLSVGAGVAYAERQFPGDELHRIGVVAASAVDLRIGLALVLAAVLGSVATSSTTVRDAATARAIAVVTLVAAALTVVLTALAVRAQYHQLDLRRSTATTAFHLSQGIYVVGTLGPAFIAAALATRAVLPRDHHR